MKELIRIEETNGKKAVSAKELYLFLGYDKSQWSRWSTKNITSNIYAIPTDDYIRFDMMSNGNKTHDFALSIDFAKKLSMIANTRKGEEARKYFIECEKQLQKNISIPQSFSEALQLAADQAKQLELQAPKVKFADNILKSDENISMANMAKLIGIGRNKLFSMLREDKILMSSGGYKNTPYQKHIDSGHFVVTETSMSKGNGLFIITLVTPKGQNYIVNKYKV